MRVLLVSTVLLACGVQGSSFDSSSDLKTDDEGPALESERTSQVDPQLRLDQTEKQLNVLIADFNKLENELNVLKDANNNLRQELGKLENAAVELNKEKKDAAELKLANELLEKLATASQKRIQELEQQMDAAANTAAADKAALQQQVEELTQANEATVAQAAATEVGFQAQLDAANAAATILKQQVDTAKQAEGTCEEEKLTLQKQVTDLNNQLQSNDDAPTAQLEEMRQKIAQLTDEATAKDAQLQADHVARVTLAHENDTMSLEDSHGQRTRVQTLVDKLNANLQTRDTEAKEAAADRAALEYQVADLKSKVDDASPAAATTVTRKKHSKTPVGMIVGLVLVIVSVSGVGVYFWNLQTHISSAATNAV